MTAERVLEDRARRRAKAAKALQDVLTIGDVEEWPDFSFILSRSLSEDELGLLAWAALRALPDEIAVSVCSEAVKSDIEIADFNVDLSDCTDTFRQEMAIMSARAWAREASQIDLKSMAIASTERMSPRTRAAFKTWMMGDGK